MDHTELGRAGELAMDLYAMVSSDGELQLFTPVADDAHVDAKLLGPFARSGACDDPFLRWSVTSRKARASPTRCCNILSPACRFPASLKSARGAGASSTPPRPRPREPYLASVLQGGGPVIAASDSLKAVADQVARWSPQPFIPLGTDGYGRSDTREALRRHFEVDAESIAVASLHSLALCEQYPGADVARAIAEHGIDPERPEPRQA